MESLMNTLGICQASGGSYLYRLMNGLSPVELWYALICTIDIMFCMLQY